jgi:hypothetical protein
MIGRKERADLKRSWSNYSAQTTKSLQTVATAAAYVARINGVTGTASPVWAAATQLLSDNQTRVRFIAGVRNASDTAIKVTVSQAVPLYLAGMLTSATSRTVSATAIAELAAAGTGPAVCPVSLSTTTGVSISNGSSTSGNGCTLRPNAGISNAGGSNFGFNGAIHAPNGPFLVLNGVLNSTSGCAEIVANAISLTGGTAFGSNCSPFGLPEIYSQQTTSVAMVQ